MVVDEDESNAVLANTGADAATEMIIQYLFLGLVEHEMITNLNFVCCVKHVLPVPPKCMDVVDFWHCSCLSSSQ